VAGFHYNFARRPFRDYRPVYLVAGGALLVGLVLFAVNATLYGEFRREVADTRDEIVWLEKRDERAAAAADQAREALRSYQLSALAGESRGLLRLVEERRFSWITLLGRLERVLPAEVRLSRLQPAFLESGEVVINIGLLGRGPESVVRTVAALSSSPYFAAVELQSELRPEAKAGVPEGHAFVITTLYTPEVGP
jgi:Tfp pilus assembly protein PilN